MSNEDCFLKEGLLDIEMQSWKSKADSSCGTDDIAIFLFYKQERQKEQPLRNGDRVPFKQGLPEKDAVSGTIDLAINQEGFELF